MTLESIVTSAEEVCFDLDLGKVRSWKEETGGKAIGHLPIYVPREVIHAAKLLPVGLFGGGDRVEIIRGDAYFQSYICHLPRSTVELMQSGRYDLIDGFLFPSICDVIRNLSGMWQMMAPDRYVRYIDVPQNYDRAIGGRFWEGEIRRLADDLGKLSGHVVDDASLAASLRLYDDNRRALDELYTIRRETPWLIPASEAYVITRAGATLPVDEHTTLVRSYLELARASDRHEMDMARVVVIGTFCEQPPLPLIRTLERSGCYVVDDDFMLGMRLIIGDTDDGGDPFQALSLAYLENCRAAAARYIGDEEKGRELIDAVRASSAEGVVFAAPSFCDPALLDQPMQVAALDREGIQYTAFKYSENTGQFAVIREQAGTFADSIRLWSETA